MEIPVTPETFSAFTFGNVKVGDMFLNDEGHWFMKVLNDEADCCEQDVFGLSLEDGKLYIFESDDAVTKFFKPSKISIE